MEDSYFPEERQNTVCLRRQRVAGGAIHLDKWIKNKAYVEKMQRIRLTPSDQLAPAIAYSPPQAISPIVTTSLNARILLHVF